MPLLLGTTNANKVREIRAVLGPLFAAGGKHEGHEDQEVREARVQLLTLGDLPPVPEPAESFLTYWENARAKALAYAQATGLTVVAEDSGLEVLALGGSPGVHSARFLGPDVPYPARFAEIERRLAALGNPTRDARFVTALAVVSGDRVLFETEAAIDGVVAPTPAGENGFGYDPIFYYAPLGKTTGEMTLDEKAAVSHRARAFRDFARWAREYCPYAIPS